MIKHATMTSTHLHILLLRRYRITHKFFMTDESNVRNATPQMLAICSFKMQNLAKAIMNIQKADPKPLFAAIGFLCVLMCFRVSLKVFLALGYGQQPVSEFRQRERKGSSQPCPTIFLLQKLK